MARRRRQRQLVLDDPFGAGMAEGGGFLEQLLGPLMQAQAQAGIIRQQRDIDEENRRRWAESVRLRGEAVTREEERYGETLGRREADILRGEQTAFDNARRSAVAQLIMPQRILNPTTQQYEMVPGWDIEKDAPKIEAYLKQLQLTEEFRPGYEAPAVAPEMTFAGEGALPPLRQLQPYGEQQYRPAAAVVPPSPTRPAPPTRPAEPTDILGLSPVQLAARPFIGLGEAVGGAGALAVGAPFRPLRETGRRLIGEEGFLAPLRQAGLAEFGAAPTRYAPPSMQITEDDLRKARRRLRGGRGASLRGLARR